ncbi:MAG: NADH-quinone oxidoreductase subunit A [Longimicrobiales bacterium]
MRASYLPILVLLLVAGLNAVMMVMMSHMLNPRRATPQKDMPYESGMIPLGDTRQRFSVKFYLFAIAFIVFDVETMFLIPWAVIYRELGVFGFIEGLIFVSVLGVGLLYMWKKGALDWE